MSENNVKLWAALFAARQEIGTIAKEAENPFFHSKYADLPSVLDAITPALVRYGLLLVQPVAINSHGFPCVHSLLVHVASGETMESEYPLPGPDEPQKLAAALTYGRRCGIAAMLGLNVDEDDDGNTASGRTAGGRDATPTRAPQSAPARPQAQPQGGTKSTLGECPYCHAHAILKGKAEFGGGWLCWKKEGGCGTKFQTDPALMPAEG